MFSTDAPNDRRDFNRCKPRLSLKASIESPQRPVNARSGLASIPQDAGSPRDVSLASPALLVAKERFEISVESLEKLVDLDDVVDRDWLARRTVVFWLNAGPGSHVLLTQAP
jgi:hypothetical protein